MLHAWAFIATTAVDPSARSRGEMANFINDDWYPYNNDYHKKDANLASAGMNFGDVIYAHPPSSSEQWGTLIDIFLGQSDPVLNHLDFLLEYMQ